MLAGYITSSWSVWFSTGRPGAAARSDTTTPTGCTYRSRRPMRGGLPSIEEVRLRRPVLEAQPLSERKALVAALLVCPPHLEELRPDYREGRSQPGVKCCDLDEFVGRRRISNSVLDVVSPTEGEAGGYVGHWLVRNMSVATVPTRRDDPRTATRARKPSPLTCSRRARRRLA